jgi:Transposase IS116/IS110/IS902 family
MGVLEQVVRTKGRIHAILHANLIPKYSGHLFGKAGKKWLAGLPLPEEEKAIVGRLVDELGRNSDQLAKLDMTIIREALASPRVVRLMTIPGIGPIVASTVLASIGDISRFRDAGEVELLFWIDAEGSPIRRSPCAPRTDQQAGKHARPQDACRGGVVREDGARSVEGVLSTGPAKSGCARRGRRNREKAGGDDLARSDGWDGVRLRAARLHRHEATQSSAQSRRSARVWQGGPRSGLLDQGDPRAGSRLRAAC